MNTEPNEPDVYLQLHDIITRKYMYRFRFKLSKSATHEDYRPVLWPIKNPYWCSGESSTHFTMVAFAESRDDILRPWPEAEDIEASELYEAPVFTSRFPAPLWYIESRMAILKERYHIFEPAWSWGEASILVLKSGHGLVHVNFYKDGSVSISDLFVKPEARRRGIGLQLLSDAEELARLHGTLDVFLWANPDGWCRKWYYRRGYRIVPNANPTPSGDIYMQKDFTNYKTVKP